MSSPSPSQEDVRRNNLRRPRSPRLSRRRLIVAFLIVVVMFFGPQVVFRHRLDPFSTPESLDFHGRGYGGGGEFSAARAAELFKIGRGVWPEKGVFAPTKGTGLGSAHTWIVIEEWDGTYHSYSLQGGP